MLNQNNKYLLLLAASSTLCYFLLSFLRVLPVPPGIDYGVDVYYHIKAGEMFPFFATTKVFPWVEMSVWKKHFYDKELGFHFLLYLFQNFKRSIGLSVLPPFNNISLFFSGTVILMFSIWGYLKSRKTAFIVAPVLIFISPDFFQKLITVRPFIVSIILFSFSIFILLSNILSRKKIICFFVLGWIYALFYSVPHILLLPLFVFFAVSLFFGIVKRQSCFESCCFPVAGFSGIIAGLTFHPQFPNTYYICYIQGITVILKILGLTGNKVVTATEIYKPGLYDVIINLPVFILFLLNLLLFVNYKVKKPKIFFLFVLQIILMAGFFLCKRTIEYLVPVQVIFLIYAVSQMKNQSFSNFFICFFTKPKTLLLLCFILIIIMLPLNKLQTVKMLKSPGPYYEFGKWQKKKLRKGTYIGLINWGDFPRLFYVSPELKYSMAMDPMFSYYKYPERTELIESFSMGDNRSISTDQLAEAFGTNLIYIPNYYIQAAFLLIRKGAGVIYKDNQGCLLKL
ncbi:MAG: hypothetical protein K9M56_03345 [Victivallales bacterium]|nr:hypothetical protein [Victivallales bacterium]